jgi:hypothetical protein
VQLQRGSGEVDESWLWKKTGYVFTELSNVMKIQKDASHKASSCWHRIYACIPGTMHNMW